VVRRAREYAPSIREALRTPRMIEYLVPAFNAVNMDLSRPYPRNLLACVLSTGVLRWALCISQNPSLAVVVKV
jgi:hypothetical protein